MFDYIGAIRSLVREHGLSTAMNPGGAEFHHPKAGRLQISAMDDAEDHKVLVMWLLAKDVEHPWGGEMDWFNLS